MKLNTISITSATALNLDIQSTAQIVVICGRYSDLALDLIREAIGDYGAECSPDRLDDGRFVIHSDIEMDDKNYSLCYIRNADYIGDIRLAVNFKPTELGFSEADTFEFLEKCSKRNKDDSNVLKGTTLLDTLEDDRPIFIYDYFDRLDEAIDPLPIIEELASLGRQVFVSVCQNYPVERLSCDKVQLLRL